ncbi:MAG: nicotinate (nicotinamide) nucleotide adenylyltransferase [Myxococcales bacterium]|nr:nicotinate (nicotinamide) nucleotide adenylyltransferase [Myxococcales bacterium]
MSADGRRIGIYGGTFNPIHRGHLQAAREVAGALDLERVIFVPSAQPPHKTHDDQDPIAPARDRLRWVKASIASEPLFELNDLELERSGASYSIDTLRTLVGEFAPARLVFILGHDAFIEMGSWKDPCGILQLVDLVVVSRPPATLDHLDQWLPEFARELVEIAEDGRSAFCRRSDTRIDVLAIDALDVSASEVRSRLARGESIAKLVPEPVCEAIVSSGHYISSSHYMKNSMQNNADDKIKSETKGRPVEMIEDTLRKKLSTVIEAALARNADRPVILDVHELTSYADCLVIMSGNSNRQVRSIVGQVVKALKADGDIPLGVEGGDNATWMLIDSNDVIVHVFDPDARELFDLEALWGDAPRITLDMPELTPVKAAQQATTSVA